MKFDEPLVIMENDEIPVHMDLYITDGLFAEVVYSDKKIRMPSSGFANGYDEIWDIIWENTPSDILPSKSVFDALRILYKDVFQDYFPGELDIEPYPEYRSTDLKEIVLWPDEVQIAFHVLSTSELEVPSLCGAWSGTTIGPNETPIVCMRVENHSGPHILCVGGQPIAVWNRKEGEVHFDYSDLLQMNLDTDNED